MPSASYLDELSVQMLSPAVLEANKTTGKRVVLVDA
jgi:hypothetical protein